MRYAEPWIFPSVIVKGILMAALILGIAETSFLQAIVVATISATITGMFLVIAARQSAKHTIEKVQQLTTTPPDKEPQPHEPSS